MKAVLRSLVQARNIVNVVHNNKTQRIMTRRSRKRAELEHSDYQKNSSSNIFNMHLFPKMKAC